ncbi:MAG: metalloregulator ArsR/SmtB family transcription factor [Deltaproteobacteria bacterium]
MTQDRCDCRTIHRERVDKARKTSLPPEETADMVQLFKAMGDGGRMRILLALLEGEMCVCDLAALLKVTESAISHQLRILRQLKLVTNRREGPILYYRLNDGHILQLIDVALEHIRE